MSEQAQPHRPNHDPKWLRQFRRSTVAIIAGFAGVILATTLDLSDKALHITDRLGLTTSEPITLARKSEKSRFSDAFVRAAHRRVMLGEIFARRIQCS
jgi:hypothetical protein